MLIDGKELTAQEVLDLVERQKKELKEKDEKILKLEEEKPAEETPAEEKPAEEAPAEEKPAEEKPAEEKPAEEEAPAEEKPAEEKPAEEAPAEEKPAEEGKDLSENSEVKSLREEVTQLKEKDRKNSVEKKLSAYKAKGIPPAVIEKAKTLAFADVGAVESYKLSEDKKEVTKSLTDCIFSLLDSVTGIELKELTETEVGDGDITPEDEAVNDREAKIKAFMEKEGCDRMTAYRTLVEKQQIEEIKILN